MSKTIVLVHGLWVNGMDMSLLRQRLRSAGYDTRQFSYNSVYYNPLENAVQLNAFVKRLDSPVIHFVCHSLGGLVVRHLFYEYPDQRPGRVVTLGTPHKPSSAAKRFSSFFAGEWMLGKSIDKGLLGKVPPWDNSHELGSIAGTFRLGLGMIVPGIPTPNDGTVAVKETRLNGMKEHLIINASHFGLLLSRQASEATISFLEMGSFR